MAKKHGTIFCTIFVAYAILYRVYIENRTKICRNIRMRHKICHNYRTITYEN